MATKTEKRKTICPQCKGNGYLRALIEEGREEVITDCKNRYVITKESNYK